MTTTAWGSAFYFSKIQIDDVSMEWSIIYRFLIAAIVFFFIAGWQKKPLSFNFKSHLVYVILGALLFSFHFLAVYKSTTLITSGITAIGFSMILIVNVFLSKLIFKKKLKINIMLGCILGVTGISLIFYKEINNLNFSYQVALGFGLALIAAVIASLGNIFSEYIQRNTGSNIVQSSAWGMTYGVIIMFIITCFNGNYIPTIEVSFKYIGTLLYLAIFCTTIAFWSYLSLIGTIGANKAGYAWILAPVIALAISSIFENYSWTLIAIIGVLMLLVGNIFILANRKV